MSCSSFDFINIPVQTTVDLVANILNSITSANAHLNTVTTISAFHSRAVPSISIDAYLTRILKFAPFHSECLISLLIYLDRIQEVSTQRNYRFALTSYNIHRLLITGILVASKFQSDVFYPNSRYAKVGGLPVNELNKLELEFLFLCNFNLKIEQDHLQAYADQLLQHNLQQNHFNHMTHQSPMGSIVGTPVSELSCYQPCPVQQPTPQLVNYSSSAEDCNTLNTPTSQVTPSSSSDHMNPLSFVTADPSHCYSSVQPKYLTVL